MEMSPESGMSSHGSGLSIFEVPNAQACPFLVSVNDPHRNGEPDMFVDEPRAIRIRRSRIR